MTRVLLVGEAFGSAGALPERFALTGRAGRHLADLAGISTVAYLRRTRRTNLVETDEDWSDRVAVRSGAARVLAEMARHERVVVLGVRSAGALGIADWPLFDWLPYVVTTLDGHPLWTTLVARAPHPSGRNRWWNDPANVERARAFWRDALGRGAT